MKRKKIIEIKKENGKIIMTNGITSLDCFESFKDARGFLKDLKKDNSQPARTFLKGETILK